ncbi:MAG: hypothetical protein LBD42_00770 [Desulfovibrio sp.]|jgi:chromosomal replication initiator protein|nr:hypothetical protein [Desulfovibrio sp.]
MVICKYTLRRHLEKTFADRELTQWFDPLTIVVDENNGIIRVYFPHAFFGQWFMKARKDDFERQVASHIHSMRILYEKDYAVAYRTTKTSSGREYSSSRIAYPADIQDSPSFPVAPPRRHSPNSQNNLSAENPYLLLDRHTFDTFISNKKNDFSLAAAREAVEKVFSPAYTPLLIYGHSGSGKTHLLGAMANALRHQNPQVSFFYGGTNYLQHILNPSSYYVDEHTVFIDDIQKIYHNQTLQDSLITLIDIFHSLQRLLVLCSDIHPANHPKVAPKLLSRLSGGLIIELKKPDIDIRMQYLQQKNTGLSLGLKQKHMLYLAQNYQDIRSINGALAKISVYHSLHHNKNNMELSFERSLEEPLPHHVLSLDDILEIVSKQFSVSTECLTGKTRDKSVSLARPVAMLFCRELLGLSLVQIGKIFSGRDHSSILYSLNKIKIFQKNDKDTHTKINALKQMCLTRRE